MARHCIDTEDPAIVEAVAQLTTAVAAHYPNAQFDVGLEDDPCGVYVRTVLEYDPAVEEPIDVVVDTLYDIQVERGLPVHIYFVPSDDRATAATGASDFVARPPI